MEVRPVQPDKNPSGKGHPGGRYGARGFISMCVRPVHPERNPHGRASRCIHFR